MGESSSSKWYKNIAIIAVLITAVGGIVAATITGVFSVIAAFISTTVVQPPPSSVQIPSDTLRNDVTKTEVEQTVIQPEPSVQLEYPVTVQEKPAENKAEPIDTFQDDFEGRLRQWRAKRYPGYYNDSMRWHLSDKEHFSGQHSLSLGNEDTDKKDNNDPVHIETKEDFLLTENAVLSFKIKKEYTINLKIVLKNKDAPFKETVIKFYPGNAMYQEWRAEEIPLGLDIDEGRYTLILRAWSQGSLYLDDIKIQK